MTFASYSLRRSKAKIAAAIGEKRNPRIQIGSEFLLCVGPNTIALLFMIVYRKTDSGQKDKHIEKSNRHTEKST